MIATDIIEQVKKAANDKTTLAIQGANSKNFLNPNQHSADNIVAMKDYSGLVEYQPDELSITVKAGTSLAEIADILGKNQQYLASDPRWFDGKATIGGTLASNQSGPARPWRGSISDHLLGIRLINGKGEHLKFGGKVMKNVAGYDVARLQTGAMGAFGIITEISLKISPLPRLSKTVTKATDLPEGLVLLQQYGCDKYPLDGAAWADGQVYLRFSGETQSVNAACDQWQGEICDDDAPDNDGDFWQNLRELQLPYFADNRQSLWRFSVPATAPCHISNINTKAESDWLIDWGGARRWLKADAVSAQSVQEWAQKYHGEAILISGAISATGENVTPPLFSPPLQRIYNNLKTAFDPSHIFNPHHRIG